MTAKKTVTSVAHEVSQHEAVCAQRYLDIMSRINRMEAVMLGATGVLICGMAALIIRGIN